MRCVWTLAALVMVACAATQAASETGRTVLLLSREIRPYLLAAESIEKALKRPVTRLYLDEGRAIIAAALQGQEPAQAAVALGPEAAAFLSTLTDAPPSVAAFVLEPLPKSPSGHAPAAVLLQIPLEERICRLKELFPEIPSMGVLTANEQEPVPPGDADRGEALAFCHGLQVVAIPVSNPPDWTRALDEAASRGIRLLLFDPSLAISSPTVIRHVVAQAIHRRLLPVGYNKLFLDAGAGAAFLFSPEAIGGLVAEMLGSPSFGHEPLLRNAPYEIVLRASTMRHLGVPLAKPLPDGVRVE